MSVSDPTTIPVQLRMDTKLFQNIKRVARLQAASEDKDIDWRDLVRQALAEKFPLPVNQQ